MKIIKLFPGIVLSIAIATLACWLESLLPIHLIGSSFVQHLVKQYGEEAVINSIYGGGEPLPKTYAQLVKEWNEFIESEYTGYSKYE